MESRRTYDIDSITDVAFAVFAQRGYDATSMDDIARAAGITKASIYHHVTGKEALLERGLDRALTALYAILDEPSARGGKPSDRLAFILRSAAEVTMRMLPEVSVLFRVRSNTATERKALERRRKFDTIVTDLVHAAQADGSVRADIDAALLTRLVFGMSNSVVEWYRPSGKIPLQRIADAISALVFQGIGD